MYYYEVLVASPRYHGDKPLTYGSADILKPGRIVTIPMQRQTVVGIILNAAAEPSFAIKEIKKALSDELSLPVQLIELCWWLKSYYPSSIGQILSLILPSTLRQQSRLQLTTIKPGAGKKQHTLAAQQKKVVENILSSKQRMHLLHGETGSGKTRVYIELIQKILQAGRSSILLTPEIGLTPQLAASVEEAFPGQTVILHSNLTPAQRRNRWLRIAQSKTPLVVIGPRSALFAPLDNVGLIVLDEAHDGAYKQEQSPYYQASRVAAKLAELHDAKVILGSATPLISDYFIFQKKNLPIHRMTDLATTGSHISKMKVVNLRDREQFSKSNWLSMSLLAEIESGLKNNSQALIFLNRRGSARIVLCGSCGWQAVCPRCDVPLTYHGDSHLMRCHTCGFSSKAPSSCPVCASADLEFKSIGTKALTQELEKLFPKAKIMRFDSDNTKEDTLEAQFESVKAGEANIIVGTQMLAKGLDLPKLGVVGIVIADTGLYFPDYMAEERTYQLISQVIGRASRGHRDSVIIVQSYHPDNITLKYALEKNYESFYENQLKQRKDFGFPPYRFLLKLRVERASSAAAEKAAVVLADKLSALGLKVEISSPTPAFIEKAHNRYRWQLIIKSVNRQLLVDIINYLPAGVSYDIDPSNLL